MEPLCPELQDFFARRKISAATLERNCIMQETRYSKKHDGMRPFAAFPYYKDGCLRLIKYRSADKEFSHVSPALPLLQCKPHKSVLATPQ